MATCSHDCAASSKRGVCRPAAPHPTGGDDQAPQGLRLWGFFVRRYAKAGASSPVRSSDSADRELPLQDSNLDHRIQSPGPRATKTDKMTESGVPTSIRRPVGLTFMSAHVRRNACKMLAESSLHRQ